MAYMSTLLSPLLRAESVVFGGEGWTAEKHARYVRRYADGGNRRRGVIIKFVHLVLGLRKKVNRGISHNTLSNKVNHHPKKYAPIKDITSTD